MIYIRKITKLKMVMQGKNARTNVLTNKSLNDTIDKEVEVQWMKKSV